MHVPTCKRQIKKEAKNRQPGEEEREGGGVKREEVEDIMLLLIDEDIVVKITEDIYTLKSIIEKAKEVIQNRLKENPLITIAEVRDLLGTSRKSAKPILEYMDSIRVTKKNGTESERVAYV